MEDRERATARVLTEKDCLLPPASQRARRSQLRSARGYLPSSSFLLLNWRDCYFISPGLWWEPWWQQFAPGHSNKVIIVFFVHFKWKGRKNVCSASATAPSSGSASTGVHKHGPRWERHHRSREACEQDMVSASGPPAWAAGSHPMLAGAMQPGASSELHRFAPSTDFKDVLDVHPYEIRITPAHCKQTKKHLFKAWPKIKVHEPLGGGNKSRPFKVFFFK